MFVASFHQKELTCISTVASFQVNETYVMGQPDVTMKNTSYQDGEFFK